MKKIVVLLVVVLLTASCSSGGMFVDDKQPVEEALQTPWGEVEITKDAFLFGSAYPADIEIPDIDGMRSTAFVVSTATPVGVVAIDLDSAPLEVSSNFAGLVAPSGTGLPTSITFLSADRGFLLTSSHVIDFNPKTGFVNSQTVLDTVIAIDEPMLLSSPTDYDFDGTIDETISEIPISFPAGIAISGKKLYVSCSNLLLATYDSMAPGVVFIYDILDSGISKAVTPYVFTTDYNPTGLTPLSNGNVAVTDSGFYKFNYETYISEPQTPSSIDLIDPVSDTIVANIPMGTAYLSFQELAVTSNGKRAYIGSASYGETYEIDLENNTATRTHDNPITITGNTVGSDYLTDTAVSYDDHFMFVASSDHSTVYPVDISGQDPIILPPETFPDPFVVGFPKGATAENPTGVNTGTGGMAVRPGVPDEDYSGPDMYVLTGSPGTLVAIRTRGTVDAAAPEGE